MSRFLVNKFLYQTDRDPEYLASYAADPAGFMEWWEAEHAGRLTKVEQVSGHAFTDEERRALQENDIRTLYMLGAHPFLLWTIMLPILEKKVGAFPDAVRHYVELIEDLGSVDFGT